MRRKIEHIVKTVPIKGRDVGEIRALALSAAIEHGLDWEQTVLLVDELERLTGVQLHHVPLKGEC